MILISSHDKILNITIIFCRITFEIQKLNWWKQNILLIEKHLYNLESTITESQKNIIFNNIYQHCIFHTSKVKDKSSVSMIIKIQVLSGTGKNFIANTIRNIDINLNAIFLSYTCYDPTGCAASLINGTIHHRLFNIPIGNIPFCFYRLEWKKFFFNYS